MYDQANFEKGRGSCSEGTRFARIITDRSDTRICLPRPCATRLSSSSKFYL